MSMIKVTLPDGSVKEFEQGASSMDVAMSISEGLARNVVAVEILAEAGLTVKPVFITIDPARDTVEYLADFVANNHPEMVGLTGTAEQIAKAARAYKVYYRKQPSQDEEYYLMDHSSFSYLMVPGFGFVDFLRSDLPPEVVADRVACVLKAS